MPYEAHRNSCPFTSRVAGEGGEGVFREKFGDFLYGFCVRILWGGQIVPDFVIEKVGGEGGWAAKGRLHCLYAS